MVVLGIYFGDIKGGAALCFSIIRKLSRLHIIVGQPGSYSYGVWVNLFHKYLLFVADISNNKLFISAGGEANDPGSFFTKKEAAS